MSGFFDDVLAGIGKVAPTLASALGGPLAGTAVGAIVDALGLDKSTPDEKVAQALRTATPEQLIALKKADQDFALKMGQLNLDTEKLAYDDTANARAREIAVKDWVPGTLAMAFVAGFFTLLCLMLFHSPPPGVESILNIMVGSLAAGVGAILQYYFGASHSQLRAFMGLDKTTSKKTR